MPELASQRKQQGIQMRCRKDNHDGKNLRRPGVLDDEFATARLLRKESRAVGGQRVF